MIHVHFTTQWYMSASQHNDTCPLHNLMIHVRFTTQWYMSASQLNDTCPLHNTMIHVHFTTQWYMSASQHNDTCPLHNTMIHVRFTTQRYMSASHNITTQCKASCISVLNCYMMMQYATVQQKSVACKVSINLPVSSTLLLVMLICIHSFWWAVHAVNSRYPFPQ